MSVKLIQGLIGQARDVAKPVTNSQTNTQVQNQSAVAATTASSRLASSEAVNVSVRSLRTASGNEKIKEPKEATEVAEKVADEIRSSDKSLDAHDGLSSAAGAAHLT